MGHRYAARCHRCGAEFVAQEGGGFFFHLLHCDRCGSEKGIRFHDLGEIHLKFLKGLGMPYCGVTCHYDLWIQENYPGEPITEEEYHRAVETFAGKCDCGGHYRMDAKARCPKCHSADIEAGRVLGYYD